MKTTLSFRINAVATAMLLSLMIFCSVEEKSPETIFDNGDYMFSSFAEEHDDLVSDVVYDQANF